MSNKSNLLIHSHPDLLNEWDYERNNAIGINVNTITYGSKKKAWWRCRTCHGSYDMRIMHRTNGTGCPYCAGKRVLQGYNDLASCFPDLVKSEWDYEKNDGLGLQPDEIIRYSHMKTWWSCKQHGHSFKMETYKRTLHGYGCPYCAGNKVLKGFNDLQSLYPDVMRDWNHKRNTVNPSEITYGSGLKAWWCCHECSHEWTATVNQRTGINGTGCPECMKHHHVSAQENQVADYIMDYICSHYDSSYVIHRSVSFKRIYEMLGVETEILSDDLQTHLLKEIDIYIPGLGLAVEYDGDYWHSDRIMIPKYNMTNSESHKIKQQLCKQVSIELHFITEHDWLHDTVNVENRIKSMIDNIMITL